MSDPLMVTLENLERRLRLLEDENRDLTRYEVPVADLTGSGTVGRVAEFSATKNLVASSLVKSGAGVLTLAAAGDFALTAAESGSVVVGSGITGRLTAWADDHTVGASAGLTTAGDLMFMSASGAVETEYTESLDATYLAPDPNSETVITTITLSSITVSDTARITVNIWASSYSLAEGRDCILRLRRGSISGPIVASHTVPRSVATGGHTDNWSEIITDNTPVTTYVVTMAQTSSLATPETDYRYIKLARAVITTAPDRLAIGTTGQFLRVSGGLPVWETVSVATAVSDSSSVDLTLTSGTLSAVVLPGGVDHNSLANYAANRHFLQTEITVVSTALATGLVTVTTGTGALGSTANNSGNWDTAYGWGNHASAGYINSSLLTTRGDIIRRGASAPERYGLVVPAAGTLNYLGVANGETDPSWKSASSNPGAAAAVLASNASGYLQLVRLGLGASPASAALQFASGTTAAAGILFGDVTLYRSAADVLKTDDSLYVATRLGVGVAPTATVGIFASYAVSDPASTAYGILNSATVTLTAAAATRQVNGYYSSVTLTAGAGVVADNTVALAQINRNIFLASTSHVVGYVALVLAGQFGAYNTSTGRVVEMLGVRVDSAVNSGGGTVDINYGFKVENQTVGLANYAAYTGTGLVRFGDQVTINGSADRVQFDVRKNVTQTSDLARFGDGTTNYAAIEADGTLKFVGTATFWKDIDFPLVAKTTGANTPSYQTLTGNLTMLRWAVNDVLQCDTEEFVHEWKEASAATWHIHIITNGLDATNRYLRFELEYSWGNFSAAMSASATITSADMLIPASTADRTHLIFDIGAFTPTGGKIGAHVKARVKRVAAVGTAPTGDPFAELVQLHIECDTLGSRAITTK